MRPQEVEEEVEEKEEVGDLQVQFLLERVWFSCLPTVDEVKGYVFAAADWLKPGFHCGGFRRQMFFRSFCVCVRQL